MPFNKYQEELYPGLQESELPYDASLDKICLLDAESVNFLEKRLKGKIDPKLRTRKDHMRIVFYFKCCGIQDEFKVKINQKNKTSDLMALIQTNENESYEVNKELVCAQNREDKKKSLKILRKHSITPFFFEKNKADFLFEYFYQYVNNFDSLLMSIDSSKDDGIKRLEEISLSYQTASHFILAESLKTHLHLKDKKDKGQDIGNIHITQTAPILVLSQYLGDHPDLAESLDNKYSAFVHGMANIAPFIPSDVDKYAYLPIAKEHPEAVLALALVCEKKQRDDGVAVCISSPEEFRQKIRHPAILDFARHIDANNLVASLRDVHENIPDITFDQHNTKTPYLNSYSQGNKTWNTPN